VPTRHDSIDFRRLITKISELVPLSVVTADKAYDSEKNHELVRNILHALSVIPARTCANKKDTWKIQETNEVWMFQLAVQSTKKGSNHRFSDKTTIWRTYHTKTRKNTE